MFLLGQADVCSGIKKRRAVKVIHIEVKWQCHVLSHMFGSVLSYAKHMRGGIL